MTEDQMAQLTTAMIVERLGALTLENIQLQAQLVALRQAAPVLDEDATE